MTMDDPTSSSTGAFKVVGVQVQLNPIGPQHHTHTHTRSLSLSHSHISGGGGLVGLPGAAEFQNVTEQDANTRQSWHEREQM